MLLRQLNAVKAFGQFVAFFLGHVPAAVFQPGKGVSGIIRFHLALMTAQGRNFTVERSADIRPEIDVVGGPEKNFFHFMRFQPFFQQIGIRQMIPSFTQRATVPAAPNSASSGCAQRIITSQICVTQSLLTPKYGEQQDG